MNVKQKRQLKKDLESQGLRGEELDKALALAEAKDRVESAKPFLNSTTNNP